MTSKMKDDSDKSLSTPLSKSGRSACQERSDIAVKRRSSRCQTFCLYKAIKVNLINKGNKYSV